jgi:hypothetical protein
MLAPKPFLRRANVSNSKQDGEILHEMTLREHFPAFTEDDRNSSLGTRHKKISKTYVEKEGGELACDMGRILQIPKWRVPTPMTRLDLPISDPAESHFRE